MTSEDILIIAGVLAFYLYSKTQAAMTPGPGQPGFVGPVQQTGLTWSPSGVSVLAPAPITGVFSPMDCSSPGADPVMCNQLSIWQGY